MRPRWLSGRDGSRDSLPLGGPKGRRGWRRPELELLETRTLLSFGAGASYQVGANAQHLITADFNRDGISDLATANISDQSVSVLLGKGDGTFAPATAFAAPGTPDSLVAGDFNGDHVPDLATRHFDGSVSVLFGIGDGTFQTAVHLPSSGSGSDALAVADLDHDGRDDLVLPNANDQSISELLGNADGSFRETVTPLGIPLNALGVGDFNGDGKVDVLVTGGASMVVCLGQEDGTLVPQAPISGDFQATSIVAVDLNGDGKQDLAMGIIQVSGFAVAVRLGNGDGTFQSPAEYQPGVGPYSVSAADLNGRGVLDLLVADFTSGTIATLAGAGDGSFRVESSFGNGNELESIVTADFNADSYPDLAVLQGDNNSISVLLNQPDQAARFEVRAPARVTAGEPITIEIAALTSRGTIAVGYAGSVTLTAQDAVTILLDHYTFAPDDQGVHRFSIILPAASDEQIIAREDGTEIEGGASLTQTPAPDFSRIELASPMLLAVGVYPSGVATGDFNNDGRSDLLVANAGNICAQTGGSLNLLLGNGDGTFQPAIRVAVGASVNPIAAATGDFDRDGKLDVVSVNLTTGNISVLLGNGDGTFRAPVFYSTGTLPSSIAVADLDGNGTLDLVIPDLGSNLLTLLLGRGDGTFVPAGSPFLSASASAVAVADLTGDHRPDLVVSMTGNRETGQGGGIAVYRQSGQRGAIYDAPTIYNQDTRTDFVVIGDFNSDGIPDIAAVDATVLESGIQGKIVILLGDGEGSFRSAGSFFAGSDPDSLAVSDFNGDGIPDLAVASFDDHLLSVYLGKGDGSFSFGATQNVPVTAHSVAVADFNGDGAPDIAVGNSGHQESPSNTVAVLLNQSIVYWSAADVHVRAETGTVTLTLLRSGSITGPVTLQYTTADGTARAGVDYVASSGTITFDHGEMSRTLTISVLDAGRPSDEHSFSVELTSLSNNVSVAAAHSIDVYILERNGSDNARFADQLYVDALHRLPTADEVAGVTAVLDAARQPILNQIAIDFVSSPENRGNLIQSYYATYLGRAASPGEIAQWQTAMHQGLTAQQALGSFVGSLEYFQVHGGNNLSWLTQVFGDLFGRALDPTALGFLSLLDRSLTRQQVVTTIANSDEFWVHFVRATYDRYLGRSPGDGEVHDWLPVLEQSPRDARGPSSGEQMIAAVLGSSEYFLAQGNTSTAWAHSLYTELLGRNPDVPGLDAAVGRLNGGLFSLRLDIASSLIRSHEAQFNFIANAYATYLGRPATIAEIESQVSLLQTGVTDEAMIQAFLGSDEYFQGHGRSPSRWLDGIYHDLLGRMPDPGSLAFGSALEAGMTRSQLASIILDSPEYRTRWIGDAFAVYLNRPAMTAEQASALHAWQNGTTDEDQVALLLGSDEYFQRVQHQ